MKAYQSPMKVMRLLTDSEYQNYISHDCQQYAAQGRTFNYNKMDMLNKKYSEPKLDEELETAKSQPAADATNTTEVSADDANFNNEVADSEPAHVDLNSEESHDLPKMSDSNLDEQPESNQNEFDNNTTVPQVPSLPVENLNGRMNKLIQNPPPPLPQPLQYQEKKPFKCERCNKNFTTGYTLRRHIGTIHDQNWISPHITKNKKKKNSKSVLLPLAVPMPVSSKKDIKSSPSLPRRKKNL